MRLLPARAGWSRRSLPTYNIRTLAGVRRQRSEAMAYYLKDRTGVSDEALAEIRATVSEILSAVEREGDTAVRGYSERFDGWSPRSFRVPADEVLAADAGLPDDLREHITF